MRFKISREALLGPLQAIAGVVEKKQTMPVLSNVLIVADADGMTLTGTNIEVELVAHVTSVDVQQPGQITVPARKLSDICRALGDTHPLEIVLEGDRLHVHCGASHFTLATLPAEHFPNVAEEAGSLTLTLPQKRLRSLLEDTAFAMAQQDVRYYLNGMLLELTTSHLRSVSTDGHRLAVSTGLLESGVTEARQVIIPRKGVLELIRLLAESDEPVSLIVGDNHVRVTVGAYTFTSKLIEGKFPDYNRVIPRGGDKVLVADRVALKGVLQRAAILSHENMRGVRLQFEPDQLKVFANNPEHEQAEDQLAVEYRGEAMQIGFNVSYLIDVLNAVDQEKVKLTLSNPNGSVLIEAVGGRNDSVYVVMPMRL